MIAPGRAPRAVESIDRPELRMRAASALALTLLAAAPASAADFPVLRGSFAPASAPRATSDDQSQWDGFYIGGFAGYGSGRFRNMQATPNDLMANFYNGVSTTVIPMGYRQNGIFNISLGSDRKSLFGGFVGYNIVAGDAVIGVEADATRMEMKSTKSQSFAVTDINAPATGYSTLTGTAKSTLEGYGTIRARAGWAYGNFMPFITGGFAIGKGSYSNVLTLAYSATAPSLPVADNTLTSTASKKDLYVFGGTIGAGVDVLLASNILLRGEYQFVRFNDSNVPLDIHTVRAGVGVKF